MPRRSQVNNTAAPLGELGDTEQPAGGDLFWQIHVTGSRVAIADAVRRLDEVPGAIRTGVTGLVESIAEPPASKTYVAKFGGTVTADGDYTRVSFTIETLDQAAAEAPASQSGNRAPHGA